MSSATHSGQPLLPIHEIDSNEKFQDFARVISQLKEEQPALSTFSPEVVAYFLVKQANRGYNPKAIKRPENYGFTEGLLNSFVERVAHVSILYEIELERQNAEIARQDNQGYEVHFPGHEALLAEAKAHAARNYAEIDPDPTLYNNIDEHGEVLSDAGEMGPNYKMLEPNSGGSVAGSRTAGYDYRMLYPDPDTVASAADSQTAGYDYRMLYPDPDTVASAAGSQTTGHDYRMLYPGAEASAADKMVLEPGPSLGGAATDYSEEAPLPVGDASQTNPFFEPSRQDIGPINTSGYAEFSEAELEKLLSGATPATGDAAQNDVAQTNPFFEPSRQDIGPINTSGYAEFSEAELKELLSGATPATGGAAINQQTGYPLDQGQNMPGRPMAPISEDGTVNIRAIERNRHALGQNRRRSHLSTAESVQLDFSDHQPAQSPHNCNLFGHYDPEMAADNNPFGSYLEQSPDDRRVQDPLLTAALSRGQAPQLVQGGTKDLQDDQGRGPQLSSHNPYAEDLQSDQRRGPQSSYNPYAEDLQSDQRRGPQSSSHNPYAEALTPRNRSGSQRGGSR